MRVTRRTLVGGAVASAVAARSSSAGAVAFSGPHQPGIATPRQLHLTAAGFSVTSADRDGLRDLLRAWSVVAERLMLDPEAAGLTITFGFGESLFDERFGLADRRPSELLAVPPLRNDALVPARSGGDLYVQACSDDRQAAFGAVRSLETEALGVAANVWRQNGFRPNSKGTPRNLMGFKDGTNNLRTARDFDRDVWTRGSTWMRGGSFLLMRRIRIALHAWDAIPRERQEQAVGRKRKSGAPLGGHCEHDRVDLSALDASAQNIIPLGAHIRHAAPSLNGDARILRRGYNYDDGPKDAGLFFLAFQRDPKEQGVRLLEQLATYDRLNEFLRHVASGIYACPPGASPGGYVGETLLG